jgi:drug/metabolite transporter (DMT)-like permease
MGLFFQHFAIKRSGVVRSFEHCPYVLYFRLIERAGPSQALAVTFIAPLFAIIYGSAFLGEPITGRMLSCGVIIVGGTLLATGVIGRRARSRRRI